MQEQLTKLGMKKFTRREVMERTGWTKTRLHIHLQELMDMELVILESGKKNTVQTYKLLYDGNLKQRKFFWGAQDSRDSRYSRKSIKCSTCVQQLFTHYSKRRK